MDMLLDVNTELFPLEEGDKFRMALAPSLRMDGQPETGDWAENQGQGSLLDHYEYAMHGLVYSYKTESRATSVKVYASFGGLLMELKGDQRHMEGLTVDNNIYLLIRRVEL